jgi:hypothetical protein
MTSFLRWQSLGPHASTGAFRSQPLCHFKICNCPSNCLQPNGRSQPAVNLDWGIPVKEMTVPMQLTGSS